jgi:TolA-binding protein
LDRFNARLETGDLSNALRYATLAEVLFPPDAVPPDVLRAIASAHRRSAETRLKEPGAARAMELASLDPATREQTRLDLITAGQYFKRHADRVGISDNTAFGSSLWMAAECFDQAGDPEQAIPLFLDYVKYFPNEPRQAEARFRLGQSYQARGDNGMAAQFYRGLKDEKDAGGRTIVVYGAASYVPLAQVMLLDADPANDAEAGQLLETVVRGAVGDTASPQYRDALVELGAMKRRHGDFAGAIKHLEEATGRFATDPNIDDLRYQLADSYRQDARAIARKLEEGMPDNRKEALRGARLDRLRKAQGLFDQVRRSLEGRDARRMTSLEQLELRNSYFYLGDCAFDLKDFETAIHHYDTARERYPKDPASLVAMIQIVNAYVELGDKQRAETANNRAKAFYDSLPPTVWADPNLPMDKADWQRWLNSMSRLKPIGADDGTRLGAEGDK